MSSISSRHLRPSSALSLEEEIFIKKLLINHDPDGRQLDSELLLQATENVMCYATTSEMLVSDIPSNEFAMDNESNFEVVEAEEPLRQTIYRISREILCKCSGEGDVHTRTMFTFDLLVNYKWDAKVVLVLAAFATSYGEFWLIMQLYPENPLALLVAMLKQLPSSLSMLKPRFKALSLLVKTMIDVTKCIIKFECLPIAHVVPDSEIISTTMSQIFLAAYWVTRSTLICSSHIKDLMAVKPEQVYSNSTIPTWELSSLVNRLGSIYSRLRQQVDACNRHIEIKMYQKLIDIFKRPYTDNQEVLRMLFALKNDLPLKNCSTQLKLGVSELKDKIVILLVSKPELLPVAELFYLVQQTHEHPHNKELEGSYEIVWVPISFSDTWTDADERNFDLLSSSLPWYSVRQPQLLSSAVINFIKQEWNFKDEPIMVVLDSKGMVIHSNALDMVFIWGARGFPFSVTKETELWEEENWTLQFVFDEIDPLFTKWVEEGRNICLYGSGNLDWIREFNDKINEIKRKGLQLDMVYVGKKDPSEQVRNILAIINEELHINLPSFAKIQLLWLRLESMRRSNLRLGKMADTDHILREVSALLAADDKEENWAVIGKGSSSDVVRLQGKKLEECLNLFPSWGENVPKLGIIGALRYAIEPPEVAMPVPCNHSKVIPYADGSIEGTIVCENCKRLMKRFLVYERTVI